MSQNAIIKSGGYMSKILFILNDPPYGTERSYNGLRLAGALVKRQGLEVRVFLMGDASACAKRGQQTPNGYYNLERMLKAVIMKNGLVGVCGSCMDARGITEAELIENCRRSTLEELADWTAWGEKVLIF
jgi:uncharacterized protein involved in oxidation of intracellular sulfur